MMTPGQVVFDPQTSPRLMPDPGRGVVRVELAPGGQLYLDLYQGNGDFDTYRFHAMLKPEGAFSEGPEIITPADNYRAEADRLRDRAEAPDGPGSSVSQTETLVGVTAAQLVLLLGLFLAAILLLRAPSRGIRAHQIYALLQLLLCVPLAIVYVSSIEETAPVPFFGMIGLVPSILVGGYALIIFFVLRNAPVSAELRAGIDQTRIRRSHSVVDSDYG
jgi:hypothetical protein